MKNNLKILMVLKFIAFGFLFVLGFGFLTMSLWNWLVPALFNGPIISFYQAIGLLILSKILFGGFKGRGGRCGGHWGGRHPRHEYWRKRMEERMSSMTEEEKEKMRNRCNWYDQK
jgi:hypothetical protein